jgi:hypothetical protein
VGELFLSRGFRLRLHARDLFLARRFGFGLGAIELLGERKLRIGLHAAELVRQLCFGFRAHTGEFGAQRLAGLGLCGQTRLSDGRVTSDGGFALDPRQFRDTLLGGLGAHAFEFCGELGVGHRLNKGDLRGVDFRIDRVIGRRATIARWALSDVINGDEQFVALFRGVQRCNRYVERRVGVAFDAERVHLQFVGNEIVGDHIDLSDSLRRRRG